MTPLISIGAVAALFVLYALLRPRHCGGHCAGCSGASCARHEDHHDD